MENKPASLLAVPLGKALSRIPLSWCGGQMAGNSYRARIAHWSLSRDRRINMPQNTKKYKFSQL